MIIVDADEIQFLFLLFKWGCFNSATVFGQTVVESAWIFWDRLVCLEAARMLSNKFYSLTIDRFYNVLSH